MSNHIIECPHCGNKTQQKILFKYDSYDKAYALALPDESIDVEITYSMTECATCKQVSLYINSEFNENIADLSEAFLAFPHENRIGQEVPEIIMKNYLEAKKVMKISRPAFAILIRRGLEFMCHDQKAKGRNLKTKIDNLVSRGVIPSTLAAMGHTLRSLGNIGAHESDYTIDRKEIEVMNDFYLAMVEYVYIAPSKLTELKNSIDKKLL